MNRLIILGTGSGLSTPHRDYTHLCWDLNGRLILIDCGSNPFARLLGAGLDLSALHDVVITHRHIDHLAALPILLDQLKISGRTAPLRIHSLAATLRSARALGTSSCSSMWRTRSCCTLSRRRKRRAMC